MIYLVRHGEASASWGQVQDPGLSELGKTQAHQVAETLQGVSIEQVLTSPMARCQQTASPFSELSGLPAKVDPAVTEIPTPEGLDDRVTWLRGFMAGAWGEAPAVVSDWRATLLERAHQLPEKCVVFTHFIAINTIIGHLEGSDAVTTFRPGHCSVTTLRRTGSSLEIDTLGSEAVTRVL